MLKYDPNHNEKMGFLFFLQCFSTEAIWKGNYFLKSGIEVITKQILNEDKDGTYGSSGKF